MPNARPQCCCQAAIKPCAKGAGLDSGAAVAAQSAMPSIAAPSYEMAFNAVDLEQAMNPENIEPDLLDRDDVAADRREFQRGYWPKRRRS